MSRQEQTERMAARIARFKERWLRLIPVEQERYFAEREFDALLMDLADHAREPLLAYMTKLMEGAAALAPFTPTPNTALDMPPVKGPMK